MFRNLFASSVFVLQMTAVGGAQDCTAPCLAYSVSGELQDEWLFSAKPAANEANDISPTLGATLDFRPVDDFSMIATETTEAVRDPEPGNDRAFQDIGTYLEEFYGEARFDSVTFRFGKFSPIFGLATNEAPGFNATEFSGDYDNEERWVGEAALSFEAHEMSHQLSASIFTTDRTALSESLFTNRGRLRLSDGGAGNTSGLSSAVLALSGCLGAETDECYADGTLGYRLGLRYQKAGTATEDQIAEDISPKDELTFLAAATTRFEIADETVLRALAEVAYVDHLEGGPDDALIWTGTLELEMEPMAYSIGYSARQTFILGAPDETDHLVDVAAFYTFNEDLALLGESWKLGAGYTYLSAAGREAAHVATLRLSFELEGSNGIATMGK
jgi:hypothetical protein